MKPNDGCNNSNDACQPNSPSRVGKPYMIFGFLAVDVDVGSVVVLESWTAADANKGDEEWKSYEW